MRLYIVRHGAAEDRKEGKADETRKLTGTGIEKMKGIAAGLRRLEIRPSLVLSSPLVRARQTAEILVEALGVESPVEAVDSLSPSGSRPTLYRELNERGQLESVMLVGHQPSLGEIAGEIVCGSAGCALAIDLKKGGVCAIDLETTAPSPRGILLWLLTPSILRSLGLREDGVR